jgi:hypothetical protein
LVLARRTLSTEWPVWRAISSSGNFPSNATSPASRFHTAPASRKMRVCGLLVRVRILYCCSTLNAVLRGENGHPEQKAKVEKIPVNIGKIICLMRKRKIAKSAVYNFELF